MVVAADIFIVAIGDDFVVAALICLIVFTFDHHTFYSLFKVKWYAIGWINHDMAVGLCSELFMRLSYYIYLGYG